MGVYKIENKINGKIYIGSSKNIINRWNSHIKDLTLDKHHSYKLQKDYLEFGITNFTFEIIEVVININELLDVEQKWMDYYKCYEDNIGYNISISSKEKKTKLDLKIELDNIEKEKRKLNKNQKNNLIVIEKIKDEKQDINPFCNNDNEIIRAIANQDIEFLKNIINYKNTYYDLRDDCVKEIYEYDFSWFFNSNFCIFCTNNFEIRKDKKDGEYKYFCKCYHIPYNILAIIELVGKFKSRFKSIKFLLNIFNMSFNEIITKEADDKLFKEIMDKNLNKINERNKKYSKKKDN